MSDGIRELLLFQQAQSQGEGALDNALDALEAHDLEEALKVDWGRRLLRRTIFNLAGIEGKSFNPSIKDGLCASLHMAHGEGLREVGLELAKKCAALRPDLWAQLNIERWNAAAEEARARQQARTASPQD